MTLTVNLLMPHIENPESMTQREVEIDEAQLVHGACGNQFTTVYAWTEVDGLRKAIRGVVKHTGNWHTTTIDELKATKWSVCETLNDLMSLQDTIA